ncbi:MAG: ATP-binding cassette domain-containing protein [Pseudomonadota bacterium]
MREPRLVPLRPVPEPDAAAIRIEDLRLATGPRELLRGATLSLGRHGITALIGPNGAGKSLILRILSGLIQPQSGRVTVQPDLGRPALVSQRTVLLRRSVRANLAHALAVARVPRRHRANRIDELLALASLLAQADAPARGLSGGEQQRLAMVRALAPDPSWLLLDEPTASLDPTSTAVFESLVREVADDGKKVILVTHDRGQAARLAGDVAFLHKGRVIEHRPAAAFFSDPVSPEARAYLSDDLLV